MAMNQQKLTLYHYPVSFCSVKARMALAEKGIPYKSHIVSLVSMENYEAWFMKLNPLGQIPVLHTGEEAIPDSNAIIRYLDETYPHTPQLIPTDDSARSLKVLEFHRRLDDVNMGVLTYGSAVHEDLTHMSRVPYLGRKHMKSMVQGERGGRIHEFLEKYPEHKEVYENKIKAVKIMDMETNDKACVIAELDKLEAIMADIETHLEQNTGNEKYIGGENFTIADIVLAITMHRMKYLGFSYRCWEHHKCPQLDKYYNSYVINRPSFVSQCEKPASEVAQFFIRAMFKKNVTWVLAILGLVTVAGVATLWYTKSK